MRCCIAEIAQLKRIKLESTACSKFFKCTKRTMEQNVALPGETALSDTKPASIPASLVSMEQFAKLREVFLPHRARIYSLFEILQVHQKVRSTMEQNVALPGGTALSATKPASIHASLVSMEQFAKLREVFLRLQLLPK
ncbi:hypothetical protein CDAR_228971 [Caerostris darwini]|uniref:Uncharacterized protein n=1 Tax=Caerostris darwini TaxID=1538125 RepID=A0AAV4SB95_9ARAC|nr:hypothetical protein CDAR_228971 [Caerostris darwini]